MAKIIEVYAPGEKVTVGDGSIAAMINCVALYAHGGTLYEVVWWDEGSRQSAWLNEQELSAARAKVEIGFKAV